MNTEAEYENRFQRAVVDGDFEFVSVFRNFSNNEIAAFSYETSR